MAPHLRRFALTLHVASSVGLLGAIAAFLALAIAGLVSRDAQTIYAAYPAMQLIARFVVVPLAITSLLTGVVQSLGTPWGLFRHYWVLTKLLLTAFAAGVLLLKMQLIEHAAQLATETRLPYGALREAGVQLVIHATGGICVLFVPLVLSIYKPRGTTRYGWRKQFERRMPS
ncbi:hypothetical protein [Bradyrhizobium sp.]|uniref:hypothetical protein n=1 Tax=Bradyrhizobium sp. TaxID=376 RepID=UPI00403833F5